MHCLKTDWLLDLTSHQGGFISSHKPHWLVCLAHSLNSSGFHYHKPCCYANIDMLEVPKQIEAVLAKALRHLSKLSAHICYVTTMAISLVAIRICAIGSIITAADTNPAVSKLIKPTKEILFIVFLFFLQIIHKLSSSHESLSLQS